MVLRRSNRLRRCGRCRWTDFLENQRERWARAAEIADDGVLNGRVDGVRHAVSKKRKRLDWRLPLPGTELSRVYRDRRILVQVVAGGYEYEGQHYRSLSAVARQVTGTRWNGLVFFGLAKRGETLTGKRPKRAGKDRRCAA